MRSNTKISHAEQGATVPGLHLHTETVRVCDMSHALLVTRRPVLERIGLQGFAQGEWRERSEKWELWKRWAG
jgi:hypothetical protein